jgi:membrane protease YdiL (CAAX protease family)
MSAPDLSQRSIFTLPKTGEAGGSTRVQWILLGLLALPAWTGAVAFAGQYRRNQVARSLYLLASHEVWFWAALGLAVVAAAGSLLLRRKEFAGAAMMIAAFLGGHVIYAYVYPLTPARFRVPFGGLEEALRFSLARLLYAATLLAPMLAAWTLFSRGPGWPRLALGFGDLSVAARDLSAKAAPQPAWRALIGGYAAFCGVFFLLLQVSVGFRPILTGKLWTLLPAVLLAALANALAEELVFRGVLQPALIRAGGATAGLWVQGILFGMLHWGVSVGVLAALPTSLLIGVGAVVWGKFALDTRGLGWVIAAHFLIDVAVMSAYFVER